MQASIFTHIWGSGKFSLIRKSFQKIKRDPESVCSLHLSSTVDVGAHAQQVALAAANENVHIFSSFFPPAVLTAWEVRDGILAARGKQMVLNDRNWSDATTKSDSL